MRIAAYYNTIAQSWILFEWSVSCIFEFSFFLLNQIYFPILWKVYGVKIVAFMYWLYRRGWYKNNSWKGITMLYLCRDSWLNEEKTWLTSTISSFIAFWKVNVPFWISVKNYQIDRFQNLEKKLKVLSILCHNCKVNESLVPCYHLVVDWITPINTCSLK